MDIVESIDLSFHSRITESPRESLGSVFLANASDEFLQLKLEKPWNTALANFIKKNIVCIAFGIPCTTLCQ